jgi:hypothetical protein
LGLVLNNSVPSVIKRFCFFCAITSEINGKRALVLETQNFKVVEV